MPKYAALIYEAAEGWTDETVAAIMTDLQSGGDAMKEYAAFGEAAAAVIAGGDALYPTSTATTVSVPTGKGGDIVTTDGPFAETKEVLTGFYLFECADLDEAVSWAAQIPGAWTGKVEVRPVLSFGG